VSNIKTIVLLLEPDEGVAGNLESALTSLGCQVEHCVHPHEALFKVGASTPDLVFISSPLAKRTPAGLLSSLRSVDGCAEVYAVCILPPGPEHDAEQETLMAGNFRDCLRKPVTRDDLSIALTRWRQTQKSTTGEDAPKSTREDLGEMSLRDKRKESPRQNIESVSQHDLSEPKLTPKGSDNAAQSAAFAAIEAATPTEDEAEAEQPEEKPKGPQLTAEIDGKTRRMVIEMAIGKSIMVLSDGEAIEVGSEFPASLSYKDPAPGRNRMIPMKLKLRVGSSTPVDGIGCRCSLRVEDVRPPERWTQFVRVCRAALEE